MIRDTQSASRFIYVMVFILTLTHRTTSYSWKRPGRTFIQDHGADEHWDENRIIFPDMMEYPRKTSWQPTTTPQYDSSRKPCQADCPDSKEFNPVCGTNGVTYQNMAQLQCAMRCGVPVDLHRPSACSSNVPTRTTSAPVTTTSTTSITTTAKNEEVEQCMRKCPSTPEYNPVCGTNRATYSNVGKLQCAKICGVDVSLWRHAPCPTISTTTTTVAPTSSRDWDDVTRECITNCPVTSQYYPVCGTDNVTYYNIGKLDCAKLCGVGVNVQNQGRCTDSSNAELGSAESEEDYGEENINPRHRMRDHGEYYWK